MADDVQTYQDQLAKLLQGQMAERPKPLLDPQMLALAEGFLTPGRTGSAWEALGTAAGKYRTAQEQQLQQDQAETARKIQLAQIGLQMAYEKRKEGSWQGIFSKLGQEGGEPGQPPEMPAGMPSQRPLPPSAGGAETAPIPDFRKGIISAPPLVSSETQVAPPRQTVVGGPPPSGEVRPPALAPEQQVQMPPQARGAAPANFNEISFGSPVQTMSTLERAKMAYASGMKPAEFLNDLEKRSLDETEYRDNGIWNKRTRTFTPIDKGETTKVQIGGNEYNTPTGWATKYYAAEGSGNQDMANYWRGKITGRGTGAVTPGIDRTPSAAAPSAGAAVAAGMPAAAPPGGGNLTVEQLAEREAERKNKEAIDLERQRINLKHEAETLPKLRTEALSDIRNANNLKSLVEQNPLGFGTVTGKPGFFPALSTWMASMVASKDPQDTTGIDQLVTQIVGTEADINARTNAAAIINDVLFTLRRANSGQGQWSNAENDALARTGPGLGNNPAALFKKIEIIKNHGLRLQAQANFFEDKWLPKNPNKGWHEFSIGKDFNRIEDEYEEKIQNVFGPPPRQQQRKPRIIPYTP
jgi:hypothetical protein